MINKILILGAGEGQIPLILRAKEAGWHTIVVSPKGDYPGFELADEIAYCNIADINAVVDLAKTLQVQAIATDQTDIPVMAIQRVAKEMGVPAIRCVDINNFRYKSRMRELCQSAGIKTIPYLVTSDIQSVNYFLEQQVGSIIIKPVDSQGSRGVTQVKTIAELQEAFDKAMSYSKEKKVIAEQFIDGQEVEVDTVMCRDEIKAVLIGDVFNFESIQIFSAYERIYPSQLPTATQDEIRRVNAQTLKVLGLHTGWTHGEYMVANNGDVYLLEVGARGGGNYIGSDIVKTMIGVSTDEMAFRTAIRDESFYSEVGLTNKCCAYKCFCLPEGTISAINIDEAWLNSDIVLRHNLEGLHVGKICHRTTDKTTRFTVIVVADNHRQLREIMDDIPNHISIEVTSAEGKKGCIWQ